MAAQLPQHLAETPFTVAAFWKWQVLDMPLSELATTVSRARKTKSNLPVCEWQKIAQDLAAWDTTKAYPIDLGGTNAKISLLPFSYEALKLVQRLIAEGLKIELLTQSSAATLPNIIDTLRIIESAVPAAGMRNIQFDAVITTDLRDASCDSLHQIVTAHPHLQQYFEHQADTENTPFFTERYDKERQNAERSGASTIYIAPLIRAMRSGQDMLDTLNEVTSYRPALDKTSVLYQEQLKVQQAAFKALFPTVTALVDEPLSLQLQKLSAIVPNIRTETTALVSIMSDWLGWFLRQRLKTDPLLLANCIDLMATHGHPWGLPAIQHRDICWTDYYHKRRPAYWASVICQSYKLCQKDPESYTISPDWLIWRAQACALAGLSEPIKTLSVEDQDKLGASLVFVLQQANPGIWPIVEPGITPEIDVLI